MVTDTLLAIQPNLILYSTPMEAAEAAAEIEQKFRSKYSETGDEGEGGEESDEEEEGGLLEGGSQEDYEEEEEEEEEVEVCFNVCGLCFIVLYFQRMMRRKKVMKMRIRL